MDTQERFRAINLLLNSPVFSSVTTPMINGKFICRAYSNISDTYVDFHSVNEVERAVAVPEVQLELSA